MADRAPAGGERLRTQGVLMVEQGGRGGVADYTACLVRELARRGIPVVLATAEDHLYAPEPGVEIRPIFHYVRGHSRAGALVRRMGAGWIANGLSFLASLPALVALARSRAVVHLQGWERNALGVIATLAMRAVGARIVFTAHNTFERQRFELDGVTVFGALARATIVHAQSDVPRARGVVTRIPHGHYGTVADSAAPVDPEQARASLGLPADALVVLLFGVLRPDKGLADLLDAAAVSPRWHVLVAGEDHGALDAVAPRLAAPALAGRLTVHEGFHTMDAVAGFFAAADIVALPYRQASQSGVLHLAYGFERPVVAYPVGGLTEAVIPGRTGWICAQPTPAALAAALQAAAQAGGPEMRALGRAARAWSLETFDWGRIAQATEAVYARVLTGAPVSDAAGSSDAGPEGR